MNDIKKAIKILNLIKYFAKRDMYKNSVYSRPELAQDEIDACDLAISALEKQLNGYWISVSDRLPEEKTYVICTNGIKVRELLYRDNSFLSGVLDQTNQVTHWQPLPEKYIEI